MYQTLIYIYIYITSLSNQETFTGAAKMLNRLLLGNANAIAQ